jgi:hypothetical protein
MRNKRVHQTSISVDHANRFIDFTGFTAFMCVTGETALTSRTGRMVPSGFAKRSLLSHLHRLPDGGTLPACDKQANRAGTRSYTPAASLPVAHTSFKMWDRFTITGSRENAKEEECRLCPFRAVSSEVTLIA